MSDEQQLIANEISDFCRTAAFKQLTAKCEQLKEIELFKAIGKPATEIVEKDVQCAVSYRRGIDRVFMAMRELVSEGNKSE